MFTGKFVFDLQRFKDIYNDSNYSLLSGTSGNDSIFNWGSNVTISGGAGNDSIDNFGANVTISGGKGNDSIYNNGENVTIDVGAGDDSIENYGSNVTISGGAGNDFINNYYSENVLFKYSSGDGNDTITGFNSTSTLQIMSGSVKKITVSGTDIFLTIGKGTIKLAEAFDSNLEQLNIINQKGKSMTLPAIEISGTNANDTIFNFFANAVIDAGKGNDYIDNNGANVTINGGAGDDYINNWEGINKVSINGGAGNDSIQNEGLNVTINGGAGNDYINNWNASNVSINGGEGNDSIQNWYASNVSINGGDGDDSIENSSENVTISGGAGNDSVSNWSSSVTINTGAGNDCIDNFGANVLFKYSSGDGNDIIYGFNETSTLQIGGGTGSYSTKKSNGDIIVTVGKGKITLLGAEFMETLNIKGKKSSSSTDSTVDSSTDSNSWTLNGTTATYGTSKKTLVTVKGVKSLDGLSISGKVVTVTADALSTNKVTISKGYTLALGSDVATTSKKKSWSLSGTTATYNQTTAAGYTLASDAMSISYTKKATKTLATVKGVKSKSGLSVSGKVITVSKAALGTSKVTVSSGYTLALGSDVTKTSTKKAWGLSGTTATYTQTTVAGYKLAGDKLSISYTKKATKTLATVNGAKSKSGFTLDDDTITLKTSSLSKKVSVSGSYAFEFNSDYKNAKITGSSSADTITTAGADMTITGGKGNDSLTGGSGADVFVYSDGDGNDVITNFDESDKISIKSGTAEISTSGDDVIFTVGKGKITLKKANGKNINYVDASGTERTYPDKQSDVEYNSDGTAATLKMKYSKKKFEPSNYSTYKDILVTIDASAVKHTLKITGNEQANEIIGTSEDDTIYGGEAGDIIFGGAGNDKLYGEKGNDKIYGGDGEDSLWGGKGSDTLTGGDGNDIFLYDKGDGNDVITDYSPDIDTVMILSAVMVDNPTADSSGNVTFKLGTGQITFQNGVNKYIELIDTVGNVLKKYNPR